MIILNIDKKINETQWLVLEEVRIFFKPKFFHKYI